MLTKVLTLAGRPIDYSRPPKATTLVKWSKTDTGGDIVKGSFRTIAHLVHLNELSVKKFGVGISVIQPPFNTGVAASAGTHDFDATFDTWIPGVDGWAQQRFLRANGAGAWYRHPPTFGHHLHWFTLPPREGTSISDDFKVGGFKVGKYVDGGYSLFGRLVTSSQISDYYKHAFGLSGQHTAGSDRTWFPDDIRSTIFNLREFIAKQREATVVVPRKVHGTDLSRWQGLDEINLARAKEAGLLFCYNKVSEGTTVVDPTYRPRREQARKAGVPYGGYHFARPESGDAIAEARAFLDQLDWRPGDLDPALDFEDHEAYKKMGHAASRTWARNFMDEVKRQTGRPCVFYSPWNFGFPEVPWVPRYNNDNEPPTIPYRIWQFSNGDAGVPNSHPGLGGVDLNEFAKGTTLKNIRRPKRRRVRKTVRFIRHWTRNTRSDHHALFVHVQIRKRFSGKWQDLLLVSVNAGGKFGVDDFVELNSEVRAKRIPAIFAFQEGSDQEWLGLHTRKRGYLFDNGTDEPGQAATPIAVDRAIKVKSSRWRRVLAKTRIGRGAGPDVNKPKWLTDTVLTLNGVPFGASSWHEIASQHHKARLAAAKTMAENVLGIVMPKVHPFFIVGDTNSDQDQPLSGFLRSKGLVSDHDVLGELNTHTSKRSIDAVYAQKRYVVTKN